MLEAAGGWMSGGGGGQRRLRGGHDVCVSEAGDRALALVAVCLSGVCLGGEKEGKLRGHMGYPQTRRQCGEWGKKRGCKTQISPKFRVWEPLATSALKPMNPTLGFPLPQQPGLIMAPS